MSGRFYVARLISSVASSYGRESELERVQVTPILCLRRFPFCVGVRVCGRERDSVRSL